MSETPAITIAKTRRRGRQYVVELANGDRLRIDEEVVFRHGLFAGRSYATEQWISILEEAWEQECYLKLMGMLSRRPHTETEIRRKLFKRGYNRDAVEKTLGKANRLGLLDDRQFATLFVDEKLSAGAQGRQRITAELRHRGVRQEQIEAAFTKYAETHGRDREWENTLAVAQRKWRSLEREADPYKRRQKLLAFLAQRGFDRDQCYRLLEACSGSSEED